MAAGGVMLFRERIWCRHVQVQSRSKVVGADLAWNKTITV